MLVKLSEVRPIDRTRHHIRPTITSNRSTWDERRMPPPTPLSLTRATIDCLWTYTGLLLIAVTPSSTIKSSPSEQVHADVPDACTDALADNNSDISQDGLRVELRTQNSRRSQNGLPVDFTRHLDPQVLLSFVALFPKSSFKSHRTRRVNDTCPILKVQKCYISVRNVTKMLTILQRAVA